MSTERAPRQGMDSLSGAVMEDLKRQGRRSSSAHECQEALGELLGMAMQALLSDQPVGRTLLKMQKLYPASTERLLRSI